MEIQPQDYNIWAGSQTRNGFAADEIISSLQKAIRRAMEEQACQYAYELYVSCLLYTSMPYMLWYYVAILVGLLMVTYIPAVSLGLPAMAGLI